MKIQKYMYEVDWNSDDLFGALLHDGTRILAALAGKGTKGPLPYIMNEKGVAISVTGNLGISILWEYTGKPVVLDGVLVSYNKDMEYVPYYHKKDQSLPSNLVFLVDDCFSYKSLQKGKGKQDFVTRRQRLKKILQGLKKKGGTPGTESYIKLNPYKRMTTKKFKKLRDKSRLYDCDIQMRENVSYSSKNKVYVLGGNDDRTPDL